MSLENSKSKFHTKCIFSNQIYFFRIINISRTIVILEKNSYLQYSNVDEICIMYGKEYLF